MKKRRIVTRFVYAILVASLLCGCWKVGADYVQPDLSAFYGSDWKYGSGLAQADSIAAQWWTQFEDAELNRLVDALLEQNISLRIARERIVEARAQRGIELAGLLPKSYLGGYGLRTRAADDAAGLIGVPGGAQSSLFAGAALAGWEIDLWGRVQRLVEAADKNIVANSAAYGDAAVSLVSELAVNYVALRAIESRIAISKQKVALLEQQSWLALSRRNAGTGSLQAYLASVAAVRNQQAAHSKLVQARAVVENGIAILVGVPPSQFACVEGTQLVPLPVMGRGVPASLLSRRPDVRRAEQEYAASVALVGAAIGERFPKIALGGTLNFQAREFDKLFHADTLVYAFGGGILFPLLTGGRITAQINVQKSKSEQSKLQLQQTVLNAVAEVEDSVVGVSKSSEQVELLLSAVKKTHRTTKLVEHLFSNGLIRRDDVVLQKLEQVGLEDALVLAQQQELQEVILLYRALGGGWSLADAESVEQASIQHSAESGSQNPLDDDK